MSAAVEVGVQNAMPPAGALRIVNPVLRALLRTPIGRLIRGLAVVEFAGARTGRRHRVVVGWHVVDGHSFVITPATWRANFRGGRPATVVRGGRRADYIATLDVDPHTVADIINALLRNGASARSLALRMPVGHVLSADDVVRIDRAVIRFEPVNSERVQRP